MKKFLFLLLFGFFTHIAWSIAAFLAYMFSGTDAPPDLLGSLIASAIALVLSFLLGWFYRRRFDRNALLYASVTMLMTLLLNFLISIPNGTTQIFFGEWFVYLSFIAVFVGGYFGVSQTRQA